jgi:cell wall-associated NlpC family hydrolase
MPSEIETFIERACQWAMTQVGSTAYPFLCLAFVEDAYERSNNIELDGYADAKEAADAYGAQEHQGAAPKGTFVMYNCWGTLQGRYRNWGHVGLSLGDGSVIHAWDKVRIDDTLAVEALTPAEGWTQPRYIGWAPLSEILKGMKTRRWATEVNS